MIGRPGRCRGTGTVTPGPGRAVRTSDHWHRPGVRVRRQPNGPSDAMVLPPGGSLSAMTRDSESDRFQVRPACSGSESLSPSHFPPQARVRGNYTRLQV